MQHASNPVSALRRLRAYARRHMCAKAAVVGCESEGSMSVLTSELDSRQYRSVKVISLSEPFQNINV